MGRKKVKKGTSRGSELFGIWLTKTAYSVDQVAAALSIKPVSVYALRSGYWRPSLELASVIEKLTADEVASDAWLEPPRLPRKRHRKILTRRSEEG